MNAKRKRRVVSSVPEPTRLLPEPRLLPRGPARDAVRITRHLSRVSAVEWWKAPPGASKRSAIDYVQGWTDDGAVWAEIERATGNLFIRGWFD